MANMVAVVGMRSIMVAHRALMMEQEMLLRSVSSRVVVDGMQAHDFERVIDADKQFRMFAHGDRTPYIGEIICKCCRLSLKEAADFSPSCLA